MNELYMELAISEANKAYKHNEVPVGAVIVFNNKVISKAFNTRQRKHNVINHAEIIAILKAAKKLKDWRLNGCDLYVTLKPCGMCEKIINESRIDNVFYIIDKSSKKIEYSHTKYKQTKVRNDYINILSTFFKNRR